MAEPPTAPADAAEVPPPKKKSKTKKTKDDNAAPENVDDLKARLAALEAENKALRKGKKGTEDTKEEANGTKKEKAGKNKDKKENKKEAKAKPQKAKKGGKKGAAAEAEEEEQAPLVDVSAWDDFQLDNKIMGALSRMGFSAPTHVQAECLPAAMRDRRDVIGAAQTVSNNKLIKLKYKPLSNLLFLPFLFSLSSRVLERL